MEDDSASVRALHKIKFYKELQIYLDKKQERSVTLTPAEYESLISEVCEAKEKKKNGQSLTSKDYRRLKVYNTILIDNKVFLIENNNGSEHFKYYVNTDDLFEILYDAHINTGHKRLTGTQKEVNRKYANICKTVITIFLKCCEICQHKKKSKGRGLVVKPITASAFNSRCQVDLIDMQSEADVDYKFILNYQDHLTKFCVLRPLKSKTAEAVATELLDIFCTFGAPCILQSDNGREFSNKIIDSLVAQWPSCKIVHGKPRHSQSQGSVERANQDVRDILVTWLKENNTKNWASGLKYVQMKKNRSYHSGIKRSPYEALFGSPFQNGLFDQNIPQSVLQNVQSEEQLECALLSYDSDQSDTELTSEQREDLTLTYERFGLDTSFTSEPSTSLTSTKNYTEPGPSTSSQDTCLFQCIFCDKHVNNEANEMCAVCERITVICNERTGAKRSLNEQAEKMLKLSNKRFKNGAVGQNVLIKIPDVDRSRIAPRNIMGIITKYDEENNLYQIGTPQGILEKMFVRNEFQFAETQFLTLENIPPNHTTVRTAAGVQSGSTQGFTACNCTKGCASKSCACKKKNIKCNSKCHRSTSCRNK